MFHRTRTKHNTNIKILINNNIVDHMNNSKILGVIIDSKLNWAAHILYIVKSIDILLKIRKFLQNNTMKNMHFTFIYPGYEKNGKLEQMAMEKMAKEIMAI